MGGNKKKANTQNQNQQQPPKSQRSDAATAAAKPAAKPEKGQHKARRAGQNAGASAGLATPSSTNSSSIGSFGPLADGDESHADNDSSDAESAHDDNIGSRTDDDVHTGNGDGRAWGEVDDDDVDGHDYDDGLAQDILRDRAKAPRQPGASLLSSGSPLESVLVAEVQKAAKAGEEPPAWVIKMLMPGAGHQNDIEKVNPRSLAQDLAAENSSSRRTPSVPQISSAHQNTTISHNTPDNLNAVNQKPMSQHDTIHFEGYRPSA
ncbi:unnamed protein product [Ectocarpus sp. CCAP 1310/34]|nr:unnamed protein product [Ectocarpus sp. CCAP 1310/34]